MTQTALVAALAALMALTAPATAQISYSPKSNPHVGSYLGVQIWQSSANGEFGEAASLIDANFSKEPQGNYVFAVQHPYPLLPNVRLASTNLETAGQTTLTQAFIFNNKTFAVGDVVAARFHVSYLDYTLFYELLDDEDLSLALGFTARDFDGEVSVGKSTDSSDNTCNDPNPSPDRPCDDETSLASGQINTNKIKPMLYLASQIKLPHTDISLFANADILVSADDTLSDYQVGASYPLLKSSVGDLQMNLGYRTVNMQFDDFNKLATDLRFQGAFVGIVARF